MATEERAKPGERRDSFTTLSGEPIDALYTEPADPESLGLIAAPLLAPLDADGLELGIWQPDTALEGLALVPLGLLVLVAACWISEGMAAAARAFARWGAR